MPELAGAVLGGGASSRMGRPKSRLRRGGRTLSAELLAALAQAGCRPLAFSGAAPPEDLPTDVRVVPDAEAGLGPLAGLEALLTALQAPVLVVACDMPGVDAAALRALRRAYVPGCGALVAESPEGWQPLLGIYEPSLLPEIRARLARGERALWRLAQAVGARSWRVDDPRWVANVNTPEDAEAWGLS